MPEEPYLTFIKAVDEIKKNIGGNMEGFVLVYATKRKNLPDPPESEEEREKVILGAARAGPEIVNTSIHLYVAANMVEGFTNNFRGNLYIAMEVAKARILEVLAVRDRMRRP